ncbi:Vacuolar protein sorting-associated protein 35 [Verticillium dahliae VDG2]|nr:Vacuolar protein sorting-associated protein 35 [Verticillium dahliae VDG2]
MGLPLTIQDDDVNCPLPKFDGQMQRMATLEMQVKLCRNIADINKTIFVSTTNLLLGPAVDPQFINGGRTWRQRAFVVFDDMINCGNQVAKFRKDELLQLDELLELFGTVAPLHRPEATAADATVPATQSHEDQNEPDAL